MDSSLAAVLATKFLGAVAGSILGLVFHLPKNRTEFNRRFSLSLICGVVFCEVLRVYLGWAATIEMYLAAATATAMFSWFVVGAMIRIIDRWTPPKGD